MAWELSGWIRNSTGGIRVDENGYGRCQDGQERVCEVSEWMRKGMGGVRMDERGYGRCHDG